MSVSILHKSQVDPAPIHYLPDQDRARGVTLLPETLVLSVLGVVIGGDHSVDDLLQLFGQCPLFILRHPEVQRIVNGDSDVSNGHIL